jgi:hypothetical protein
MNLIQLDSKQKRSLAEPEKTKNGHHEGVRFLF